MMMLRIVIADGSTSNFKEAMRILEYSHGFRGLGADGGELWVEPRNPGHFYEILEPGEGRTL